MRPYEDVMKAATLFWESSRDHFDADFGLYHGTIKPEKKRCHLGDAAGVHEIAQESVGRSLAGLAGDRDLEGAFKTIRRVLESQITDEASPDYGNYKWFYEEVALKDRNAGFFVTMILLIQWMIFGNKLPAEVKADIETALRRSTAHFTEPTCRVGYTNSCLGKMACGVVIAERFKDEEALNSVADNWELFYEMNFANGIPERISPVYYGVNVMALSLVIGFCRHPRVVWIANETLDVMLQELMFFSDREPIPCKRTYNYDGGWRNDRSLAWILGLCEDTPEVLVENGRYRNFSTLATWLLLDAAQLSDRVRSLEAPLRAPRSLRGKYFDGAVSSYFHKHYHIGAFTIYRNPLSDDIPAGFSEGDGNFGLLGMAATLSDGSLCAHPKAGEFDSCASFEQKINAHRQPDLSYISNHYRNAMIWLADVDNVNAELHSVGACLRIPRFRGDVYDPHGARLDAGEGRTGDGWLCVEGMNTYVGIRPLKRWDGRDYFDSPGFDRPDFGECHWRLEPHDDACAGERKLFLYFPNFAFDSPRTIICDNLSNGVFVLVESKDDTDLEAFMEKIRSLRVTDSWEIDCYYSRTAWYEGVRTVNVASAAAELCLRYDYKFNKVLERSVSGVPTGLSGTLSEIQYHFGPSGF